MMFLYSTSIPILIKVEDSRHYFHFLIFGLKVKY